MISHKHKSVFIHIPKCGGQSIEDCFIKENGLTWESKEPLLLRPNKNPLVGPPRLAHLTYLQYLEYSYISQDLMDEYYKFALVRNPFSRLESIYKYLGYDCVLSFKDFIGKVVTRESKEGSNKYYFFRPQMDFICDADGRVKVDDIYRLEDLDKSARDIFDKTQLSSYKNNSSLPHLNKSLNRGALSVLKERLRHFFDGYFSPWFSNEIVWEEGSIDIVERVYEVDFNGLGYPRRGNGR